MVSVKLSENSKVFRVSLLGHRLTREASATIRLEAALVRLGDRNLDFTFEESDREELMQINPDIFPLLSAELGHEITTHVQLAEMLLPPKVVVKPKAKPKPKPAPKPKQTAKTTVSKVKKSALIE